MILFYRIPQFIYESKSERIIGTFLWPTVYNYSS